MRLVEYPEAMQVRDFAGACQSGVGACTCGALVSHSIGELRQILPGVDMRPVAIYRRFQDEPDRFVACGRLHPGGAMRRSVCAGCQEHIAQVLAALHRRDGWSAC